MSRCFLIIRIILIQLIEFLETLVLILLFLEIVVLRRQRVYLFL